MRIDPRNGLRGALAVALVAALCTPAAAGAGTSGGTTAPAPAAGGDAGGGTRYTPGASAEPQEAGKGKRRKRRAVRPELVDFRASASRFYDLGRPARVTFRIDGRSDTVAVRLHVLRQGARIRTIELGDRATGRRHSFALTGREGGLLPEGELQLRLTARDPRGRGLSPTSSASSTDSLAFHWHRFPLVGQFSYGGEGSRFGADRTGHVHQGQDLTAPQGTPVVAPRAGVVQTVAYQGGGAGHYVVLRAEGEDRSYVFMHLADGSVRVSEGQQVRTGERLGDVGSTGSSSGPHLHFEIWVGPWQAGGEPIDPLADLRRWDAWS